MYCMCMCVYMEAGSWAGRWKNVVLGQSRTLAPLWRCTEGCSSIRMDVESKVDSCSSLLEIISFHCTVLHYIHAHKHTLIHTMTQTDCLSNSKPPGVVTVTAYVIGLNEQNKNKPQYH